MCYNTNIKYINLVKKDLKKQIKIIKKEEKSKRIKTSRGNLTFK